MLDDMFAQLAEKGLSPSSVKYAHRIIGVALEHARKYHYIESNPARDVITKFGKQGKTPDPYTVEEMRQLLAHTAGTDWEMLVTKKLVSSEYEKDTTTFRRAYAERGYPQSLTFHSDRGGQYISAAFSKLLQQYGVKQSFFRKRHASR